MEMKIAEFIGGMLGDGHIGIYDFNSCGKKKKLYQLKITLDSRNRPYTKYIFNLMKEVIGECPKIYYKKK